MSDEFYNAKFLRLSYLLNVKEFLKRQEEQVDMSLMNEFNCETIEEAKELRDNLRILEREMCNE